MGVHSQPTLAPCRITWHRYNQPVRPWSHWTFSVSSRGQVRAGPLTLKRSKRPKKSPLQPHRAQQLRVRRDHVNFESKIARAILAVQQKGPAIYLSMLPSQTIFLYHHVRCANYGAQLAQLLGALPNKLPVIRRIAYLIHSSRATLSTMIPMPSNMPMMASRLPVQQLCQAMTVL
ncbi:hypothetical protein BDV34DRAFT_26438 [Aspergillus parasiticus]|uniref:Uncharacterized protein n=1 Tax=Aspergillus parasiticus TaxID=5067 RepID=A0A5N6D6M2_ASPPA|nr:hypothetical protein BDV34DRAFT_26438 [Aspergillus parasiticus]